jgi:hypothetical protein
MRAGKVFGMRSLLPPGLRGLIDAQPAPWLWLIRRWRCDHRACFKSDEYHEAQHGHYDEYICTRHVIVLKCWACGKRRKISRVVDPAPDTLQEASPPKA